jgi:DNA-binding response OmpR family regulator
MGEKNVTDHQKSQKESTAADDSVLQFGEFHLDRLARRLMKNGRRIRIQQKPLDVLTCLASSSGFTASTKIAAFGSPTL